MNLHEDKKLFKQAIRSTAEKKGLLDIYIEKDYWVTLALNLIFQNEIGTETVFKGGTALSKCFGLIERFSEDIDLVVLKKDGESNNSLTTKIKNVGKVVSEVLPEIEVTGLTRKRGMNRKTAHSYDKEFGGSFGQVRDIIVIEATWLGSHDPFSRQEISSYIYEMLEEVGQMDIAEKYNMMPFSAQVLDVQRTICEKIMSLVRFCHGENPIDDLRNKVRHTYDIHQLLKDDTVLAFFNSTAFDRMLTVVAKNDIESFKNNNKWLAKHPKEALIFTDTKNTWSKIESSYSNDFRELVYGKFPSSEKILKTLIQVRDRIQPIKWSITISDVET